MNLDQTEQPARWSVSELIDFEVALDKWDADDSAGVDAFKSKIALAPDARTTNRSAIFLAWLKEQATPGCTATAGQQFERGVKAVLWLALFIGGLVGVGTTAGLLAHDSAQPINAALFLAGTVGLQIGMLLVALVAVVARAVGVDFSPLTSWMHALVRFSIGALNRLHGEQRAQARFLLAKTGQLSSRLAPFISLQVLQLTQAFVIAFNLGILGSMLLVYLPFVELRFGWQSTYSFGADGVFRALQAIALPWSWISDSLAPSLPQVLATQFVRGQGAFTLDANAAHAWWPFLLCAVVVYGLMPRLLIAALLQGVLRLRLRRIAFTHPAANKLWRRLQRPLFSSDSDGEPLPPGGPLADMGHAGAKKVLAIKSQTSSLSDEQVSALVQRSLGLAVLQTVSAYIDNDAFEPALVQGLQADTDVVVVTPGTENPIIAIADFLKKLSATNREVIVLLTGDPTAGLDERLKIWTRFVSIHHLRVGVARCQ
ncbi:DUF2868 domain-containing protein [Candidatus Aalborgicola defluviihabitans]|uniref:DUF2868 domain-containing protein n=1 Tax=Candidatus Aalborgicola defluviihabitans TaxID=3386187 RepID=UPI001E180A80|nr:DUF2868 domain-containing protein [Burkholderiales bacterium]